MRYETKLCPRCGAELYADMSICYGCLYDFTRGGGPARLRGTPRSSSRRDPWSASGRRSPVCS